MQQALLTDHYDRWRRWWFLIGYSCKYSCRWRRKCTCEQLNLWSAFQCDTSEMMICLLHLFVRNMKLTYMIYLHSLLHNWAGLGWAGLFFLFCDQRVVYILICSQDVLNSSMQSEARMSSYNCRVPLCFRSSQMIHKYSLSVQKHL